MSTVLLNTSYKAWCLLLRNSLVGVVRVRELTQQASQLGFWKALYQQLRDGYLFLKDKNEATRQKTGEKTACNVMGKCKGDWNSYGHME